MAAYGGLARLMLLGLILVALSGCPFPEGIGVSNTLLSFERNERPMFLDVWNLLPDRDLDITVSPSVSWIVCFPTRVTCKAAGSPDDQDVAAIQVTIDRTRLAPGTHEGKIRLRASGVRTAEVRVTVTQDAPGTTPALSISQVTPNHQKPYIIEYSFLLRDRANRPVVADPAQFDLMAWEGGTAVDAQVAGLQIRRLAARQTNMELVLDYSALPRQQEGLIDSMEQLAAYTLLDALDTNTLVSVSEFHRDDREAALVAVPSISRDYTRDRIGAIESEYVLGFASGARLFDALLDAVNRLKNTPDPNSGRYLVVFADGRDTSSVHSSREVIQAAGSARVIIHAVKLGDNPQGAAILTDLAYSTGGEYFTAAQGADLADAISRLVNELESRYTVRWTVLRRDQASFFPSFSVALNGAAARYTATTAYSASTYKGNVLEGRLRVQPTSSEDRSVVFIWMDYAPRNVDQLRLRVQGAGSFTVSKVEAADGGLVASWILSQSQDGDQWVIQLDGNGQVLPFAAFGPLLRLEFNSWYSDPILSIEADNSIYVNGQSFSVIE
ncbi:MAG TPA: hypothetical protein PLX03_06110 [Candidatus Hydrogenedentes bacterium]|nr:hypothetical protein [Candidatus Hydrogenedentota bacterium]